MEFVDYPLGLYVLNVVLFIALVVAVAGVTLFVVRLWNKR